MHAVFLSEYPSHSTSSMLFSLYVTCSLTQMSPLMQKCLSLQPLAHSDLHVSELAQEADFSSRHTAVSGLWWTQTAWCSSKQSSYCSTAHDPRLSLHLTQSALQGEMHGEMHLQEQSFSHSDSESHSDPFCSWVESSTLVCAAITGLDSSVLLSSLVWARTEGAFGSRSFFITEEFSLVFVINLSASFYLMRLLLLVFAAVAETIT